MQYKFAAKIRVFWIYYPKNQQIPEFVSKLNFYISAVDDTLMSEHDNPTIGLLLCRTKDNVKAEYALRGMTQPLGIAEYDMEKFYDQVHASLPSIEELENSVEDL